MFLSTKEEEEGEEYNIAAAFYTCLFTLRTR